MKNIILIAFLFVVNFIPNIAHATDKPECQKSDVWFSILEAIKPKEIHLEKVFLCNEHVDLTFKIKPYIMESASVLMETIDKSKIGRPKFKTIDGNENSSYIIRIELNE